MKKLLGYLLAFIVIIYICSSPPKEGKKTTQHKEPVETTKEVINWKNLANNLIRDYQGKIVSIEQLNSVTCWAIIDPRFSNYEAIELAENIGYYIRNSTGGTRGETPTVHVFRSGKHIAMARPSGLQYVSKISIEDWNPSVFDGKYRP